MHSALDYPVRSFSELDRIRENSECTNYMKTYCAKIKHSFRVRITKRTGMRDSVTPIRVYMRNIYYYHIRLVFINNMANATKKKEKNFSLF